MTMTLFKLKRMGKLGAKSLFEHKLRSFLTALGIIFGVSSVIAMLAIGEGASYEAREQIRSMGSSNVIIRSRKPDQSAAGSGETLRMSIYGLTYEDALRIRTLFPRVRVHVPARIVYDNLRRGTVRVPGQIYGTVPWYAMESNLHVKAGRFLDNEDVLQAANSCVLGEETAKKLFPLTYPIGETLYLGSQSYRVVGIVGRPQTVNKKTATADIYPVYISISAARKRFGEVLVRRETGSVSFERVELHQLTVTAPDNESVVPLASSIRSVLRHFHKEEDFEIIIPLELLKQAEATKRIFNIVLGSIAAISLLVGGIGIMNIMLASVTERTREIGIRRALGATRQDIILQFLAEAMILSVAGGCIGVGLGVTIPRVVTHFAGLTTIVKSDALLLAFGISVAIGIVFGIYPATRAAALSPIEALRHE